jgi:hypothetical protein
MNKRMVYCRFQLVGYSMPSLKGIDFPCEFTVEQVREKINEWNNLFESKIIAFENFETKEEEKIEVPKTEIKPFKKQGTIYQNYKIVFTEKGAYSIWSNKGEFVEVGAILDMNKLALISNIEDYKEETKQETPVEKSETTKSTESTLYEATSLFMSKADVRNFVLDNREIYEGYIVRSLNCWDSDTIYRWEEKDNGKIIWRKEKA